MRVGLVLASSTGGVGQHVASLVSYLHDAQIVPVVHAPVATEAVFGFASRGAVVVPTEIPPAPLPTDDLRAVRELRSSFGRLDVVHAHGLRAGLVTTLAARSLGRNRPKVIVTWHNAVLPQARNRALLGHLERVVARGADVTLGASSDLVARAVALGARDARLGAVAAPTLRAPARHRDVVRAELGVGSRPLVLAVTRIAPQKGLDVLVAAAACFPDDGPVVLVAGDGDPGLTRTLVEAADPTRTRFLGRRDDIPDLLGAADLVVLPSRWEARALVAQEAMLAGVPLVATAVGGLPELVGDAAVLVRPEDAGALAAAMLNVLGDHRRAAALAQAGLERAATWPDEAAAAAAVLAVYRELSAG